MDDHWSRGLKALDPVGHALKACDEQWQDDHEKYEPRFEGGNEERSSIKRFLFRPYGIGVRDSRIQITYYTRRVRRAGKRTT